MRKFLSFLALLFSPFFSVQANPQADLAYVRAYEYQNHDLLHNMTMQMFNFVRTHEGQTLTFNEVSRKVLQVYGLIFQQDRYIARVNPDYSFYAPNTERFLRYYTLCEHLIETKQLAIETPESTCAAAQSLLVIPLSDRHIRYLAAIPYFVNQEGVLDRYRFEMFVGQPSFGAAFDPDVASYTGWLEDSLFSMLETFKIFIIP